MKRVLSVAFALLAVSTAKSDAQTYPSRPITFIVPFAAGGPTDTIARVLSDRLRESLGQTIIIENVAGAGGTIGTGRVARARAAPARIEPYDKRYVSLRLILRSAHALRARVSKEEAAPARASWFETRRTAAKFTQAAQACLRCAALLTMRSKKLARGSD